MEDSVATDRQTESLKSSADTHTLVCRHKKQPTTALQHTEALTGRLNERVEDKEVRGRKRKKKLSSSCHQKVRQKEKRRKEVRTVVVVVINRELVVLVLLLLQSMMMMVLLLLMLLNTQLVHTLLLCSCSRALFQTLIPLRVLYTFMQIKCNFLSPSHSLVFFSFSVLQCRFSLSLCRAVLLPVSCDTSYLRWLTSWRQKGRK